MYSRYIIFLLITICSISHASESKLDSLELWRKNGALDKISKLGIAAVQRDPAFSKKCAVELLRNADVDLMYKAKGNYILGECLFFQERYSEAIPFYQKAFNNFEVASDSIMASNCLSNIGVAHNELGV